MGATAPNTGLINHSSDFQTERGAGSRDAAPHEGRLQHRLRALSPRCAVTQAAKTRPELHSALRRGAGRAGAAERGAAPSGRCAGGGPGGSRCAAGLSAGTARLQPSLSQKS